MRHKVWMAVSSLALTVACGGLPAQESGMTATINRVTAQGTAEQVGSVSFRDSEYGLIVEPDLRGLPPGPAGLHVHQNPNCGPSNGTPGGAAGSHYDPDNAGEHRGPYAEGHLGDLPNLIVEQDGTATLPVLAPRVELSDLEGRALMIHASKDSYHEHADHNHGAGGARAYCGIIR